VAGGWWVSSGVWGFSLGLNLEEASSEARAIGELTMSEPLTVPNPGNLGVLRSAAMAFFALFDRRF